MPGFIAPDTPLPNAMRRYCKAVAAAALLLLTAVQAHAQTVRWEDYRGDQNVPSDADYIGPPGAPKFTNFPNTVAMAALQAVAANPANAVRTGTSADINFRDFGVDPTANSLCDVRGTGVASQACLYQAQGRVAYALVQLPQVGVYTLRAAHDDNVVLDLSTDYTNTDYRAANYDIPVGAVDAWTGGEDIYHDFGAFTAGNANSCVLLRMWWTNQSGQNYNRLQWTRPDGTAEIIPASAFRDPADPGSATGCNGSLEAIPQLSLRKLRVGGNFVVGTNRAYTLIPGNAGEVPTSGTITIVDTLPAGLTFVSASGTDWTCSAAGQVVTCTSSAVMPANSNGNTITLTVAVGAAAVPSVINSARVSGGGDPTCPASGATRSSCTPSNTTTVTDAPNLEVSKSGPANASAGAAYDYTIVATNTGSVATTAAATVTDVVPAGLTINTAAGCGIAGQTVTCPIPAGLSNVAPNNTASFTINVTPQSGTVGTTVTNTASVSGGGDPECAVVGSCPSPPVDTVIGISAAYSFCAAPNGTATSNATYGIVNGVQIARYEPGAGADAVVPELAAPVPGDLNALMIDPARDRLLFHDGSGSRLWAYDADNGGWYVAATGVTGNFPRGGMTAAGVGYLMEGGTSPAVRRIDPNGTYGYTVTNLGNVTYDIAPTGSNSSGDIAFDANGDAWLLVGRDLYLVDMTTLTATRQTRPLIGGAVPTIDFAGVAFADDGSLYLANNAGGGGSAYYRYDFATGELTQVAPTSANASRDLASCAFPAQAEPDLSVIKTLAQVNGAAYTAGAPVAAGDVLTYAITISNAGTAVGTLYPGSVTESVPADTAYVAAGNTFNQASGADWTIGSAVNVPAGGNAVLNFVVQVDDPLPAGASSVANNVAFPPGGLIDCAEPGNVCSVTTPLGPSINTTKTSDPASGTDVSVGQVITYTLTAVVANAATTAPLTLTDTLGAGLTFGALANAGSFACNAASPLVCTLPSGTAPGTYAVVYTATVANNASGTLRNSVASDPTSNGGDPEPGCAAATPCTTEHNVVTPNLETGKTGPAVAVVGVAYDYQITVTNTGNGATVVAATVTDDVPAGLTINTAAGCTIAGQAVTCPVPAGLSNVAPDNVAIFTINVTPQASTAGTTVVNTASVSGGGDPDCTTVGSCPSPPVNTLVGVPDLSVAKSGPANATVGAPYDYIITVTNTGTAATIVAATVTDNVPAGLTINTAAGCAIAGQTVTCPVPSPLAMGASADFVVNVTPQASTAGTTVANIASVSGGGDPDCTAVGDCPSPPVNTTIGAPNLEVAKAGPANAVVGAAYDYTITVTNTGGAATTADATVTDTVPAGLTINTAAGCTIAGQVVTCAVPAGLAAGASAPAFTINVTPQASTAGSGVTNTANVTGGGDPDCTAIGDCPSPPVNTTIGAPNLEVAKAGPASATVGMAYDYTITVTNTGAAATTAVATVADNVPAGLTINTAAGCTIAGQTVTCPVPAGLSNVAPDNTAVFTINVTPQASTAGTTVANTASVAGGGDPDCVAVGNCPSPPVNTNIARPVVSFSKSANPASGTDVEVGDVITYTLSVTVADAPTLSDVVLTDTVGTGMGAITVTNLGSFTGGFAGNTGTFTLASGTAPGSYTLAYTATVRTDAGTTVSNSVEAAGGNPPPDPGQPPTNPTCDPTCTTTHNVAKPAVTVAKSADPAAGTDVATGDTITYTLTATVANASTLSDVVLTDTLGAGLTFGAVTNAGAFSCTGSLVCTLPTGTAPGTYAVTYTATVNASAATTVSNSVVPAGGNLPPGPGQPPTDPACTTCSIEHNVAAPVITVDKSSNPGSGGEVRAGDAIAYTLTVTVARSATTEVLTLTDSLGAGLTLDAVTDAGAFACTGALTCTLPAGTPAGTYAMTYTATVNADAIGTLRNVVVPSVPSTPPGGPGGPTCVTCTTEHELVAPRVLVAKSATPGDGQEVHVGDTIEYTLTVTVENSATRTDVRLTDTPGTGLVLGTLPAGCAAQGATMVCTLPTGTVPGVYAFTYPATVGADARDNISNVVVGESGGGEPAPECTACATQHRLVDEAQLRIVKAVGVRNVAIGDLVRYTLTIENVGAVNVADATVVDTPPAGFSYVEGSMAVADRDTAFTLEGRQPLRIGGLDIDAGGRATVVYLLRVGAGVRPGPHMNQAVAVNDAGDPISNIATAQVSLDTDPLLDDSLIFGTVFDDRDGDGWQDRADLGDVRVQGGFAPGAYIAGSTTIDRGNGPESLADASAPLLHGIDIGAISARQSEADPVPAHRVTIRQRVSSADFTGDFLLTSAQGITLRMDAAGNTMVERSGEAAKGLTAAEPTVERTVSAVDGGYEVAYAISNAGIDERGIPGVRIASVEGLLIETDQYGRYHLADVQGGDWGHGRNFILKVDPATLPPGTVFTTENPRVRRVTPGLPVRFDFGVKLPVQLIEGGTSKAELELGEVVFAPGSAEVREAYLPAIQRMAAKVDEYRGGDVVISADGDSEGLAFARAAAVRDALQKLVGPESQAGLNVVLRTRVDDPGSLVAGVGASGPLLGTVLFDTDKSKIRPEFEGLLDAVAKRLDALDGGVVVLVGHTDVRASHAYNTALGLRRATAVQQALVRRLSPEVRARVRVETSSDPAAPVGTERK